MDNSTTTENFKKLPFAEEMNEPLPTPAPVIDDSPLSLTSVSPKDQHLGTCYAHSASRCLSNVLRTLGVFTSSAIHRFFYKVFLDIIIDKFGCENGSITESLLFLLNIFQKSPMPKISSLLRSKGIKHSERWSDVFREIFPFLHLGKEYYVDLRSDVPTEATIIALANRQQPIFTIRFSEDGWNKINEHTQSGSKITDKINHGSCDNGGHSVNLYNWDKSGITFINSWGKDWGNSGKFKISKLSNLHCGDKTLITVHNIVFDENELPEHYRTYFQRYRRRSTEPVFNNIWKRKRNRQNEIIFEQIDGPKYGEKYGRHELNFKLGYLHGYGKYKFPKFIKMNERGEKVPVHFLKYEGEFSYGLLHGMGKRISPSDMHRDEAYLYEDDSRGDIIDGIIPYRLFRNDIPVKIASATSTESKTSRTYKSSSPRTRTRTSLNKTRRHVSKSHP
jgi:hypothetical protein